MIIYTHVSEIHTFQTLYIVLISYDPHIVIESDGDSHFLTPSNSIMLQESTSFIDGPVSTGGDIYPPLLQGGDVMASGVEGPPTAMQSLKWQAFMPETWLVVCDSTLQEMYGNQSPLIHTC